MKLAHVIGISLLLASCVEGPSSDVLSPERNPSTNLYPDSRTLRVVPLFGETERPGGSACFVSRRVRTAPARYAYSTVPVFLHYSVYDAARGAWHRLEYRERDSTGELTFVANCTIPASATAQEVALLVLDKSSEKGRPFGLSSGAGYGSRSTDLYYIEEVRNHCSVHPSDPMCDTSGTEAEPDLPPPPYNVDEEGDGGDTGGGADPCEFCIPEDDWEEQCPTLEPGCTRRYWAQQSDGERLALQAIAPILRQRGCGQIADEFERYVHDRRVALWDARYYPSWASSPRYGRVNPTNGDIEMWTGYNRHPGDDVNWVRTAAHETLHVMYPDMNNSEIDPIARACAGYPS